MYYLSPKYYPGDTDKDGSVTVPDATDIQKWIAGADYNINIGREI